MLIFTEEITPEKHFVRTIHYRPDMLTEEKRALGFPVESIPEPEAPENHISHLFYNPLTESFFYEYEAFEPEKDPVDKVAELEARIAELERLLTQ